MSDQSCGCAEQPCGCCEGVQQLTPVAIRNRPGLAALAYRVGTQARFLETMKARLSTMTVEGPADLGQEPPILRPLQGLTTRDSGDPSIALLDGWASVADVLSFYQERIANEGFLRTSTERRSVLELARLVGYAPRPGVAATVFLAYTLDDNQADPVVIPAGSRSQSIPGPDELPQPFETSTDVVARREWNNLQVRMHQPQNLVLDNGPALSPNSVLSTNQIYIAGTSANLKLGDKLLMVFNTAGASKVVRTVASAEAQFDQQRTLVSLQPFSAGVLVHLPDLLTFLAAVQKIVGTATDSPAMDALHTTEAILTEVYLGGAVTPADWVSRIEPDTHGESASLAQVRAAFDTLQKKIGGPLFPILPIGRFFVTRPEDFVVPLLQTPIPQVANSLRLQRNLSQSFRIGADTSPQLLINFVPKLQDSYYQAWANANVNGAQSQLQGLYVLRAKGALFGATAPKVADFTQPQSAWNDWSYDEPAEKNNNAFLDQASESLAPGGYVLVQSPQTGVDLPRLQVLQLTQAATGPRTAYGVSGQSTRLEFDSNWRLLPSSGSSYGGQPYGGQIVGLAAGSISATGQQPTDIRDLRATQLYAQSEALALADMPLTDDITTPEIVLDGLYGELKSGRWVILSGERADVEGVEGVSVSELLMISGLVHGFDPNLPGDQVHTKLILATPLAYKYRRSTLKIYGNVVKATHGQTRSEALGSGDGTQSLQSFTLKQPPLTFVAAPTAAGAQSTLHVYVNNVEWHESDSLAGLGPTDRKFVTSTDDDGNTSLIFGNGSSGARLPTGVQNVNSVYRNGIGMPGNVDAGQISLLQTRPLGVKSVLNPLRASGGADRESRDLARDNAPLSVMPLDRLVAVQDYADFTRNFAGIAKAAAQRLSDGRRELIYLTIAGVDDIPIDPDSDLYQNLLQALRSLGDPDVPVRVDLREQVALVLSAKLKLLPDYQWEPVAAAVRARLLDSFGFDKRALGQPALRCEVISAMQNVPGVAYVDIDAFGGVAEKSAGADGSRVLATQQQISQAIQDIVHPEQRIVPLIARFVMTPQGRRYIPWPTPGPSEFVYAGAGGMESGGLAPAQLAVFSPAVTDTLILNQIP